MPALEYARYTERATGEGHPTREDTINRALKQLIAQSGLSPDDPDVAFANPLGLATEIADRIAADVALGAAKQNIIVRGDVQVVTGSIVSGVENTGTAALGKRSDLLAVTVTKKCRLRLYYTSAARTADSSRPVGTDPATASGLLCELVFTVGTGLTLKLSPLPALNNMDTVPAADIYYAIRNDDTDGVITITFTRILLEP